MSLTITVADVKRKCRLSVTDYDTDIQSLITETKPVIEYAIADRYLNDTSNTGLQATLQLGALEVISGEMLSQLLREEGATEQLQVGDFTIGDRPQRNRTINLIDPYGLKTQGWNRLAPYLKAHVSVQSESKSQIHTADPEFTEEAMDQW
jgi:hypothetical protein